MASGSNPGLKITLLGLAFLDDVGEVVEFLLVSPVGERGGELLVVCSRVCVIASGSKPCLKNPLNRLTLRGEAGELASIGLMELLFEAVPESGEFELTASI